MDGVIQELDEDVEAMQSTILLLQQELKTTKDRIEHLENENKNLKDDSKRPLNGIVPCATSPKPELQPIKEEECDNDKINGTITENLENGSSGNNGKLQRQRKRNYDSDASDIGGGDTTTEVVTTKRVKRKTRRSSILDSVDETIKPDAEIPTEQSDAPATTEGSKKILTRRKSSRNLLNGTV